MALTRGEGWNGRVRGGVGGVSDAAVAEEAAEMEAEEAGGGILGGGVHTPVMAVMTRRLETAR
jgi:hypothetical protein